MVKYRECKKDMLFMKTTLRIVLKNISKFFILLGKLSIIMFFFIFIVTSAFVFADLSDRFPEHIKILSFFSITLHKLITLLTIGGIFYILNYLFGGDNE